MRYFALCVAIFLFANVVYAASVDSKVLEAASSGEVSVIVMLGEGATLDDASLSEVKKEKEFEALNGFSGKVSKEGLDELINNPSVSSVQLNKPVRALLAQSAPLVNATQSWALQINGTNITGKGETVCIIDTGIDYNHTALGGGWGNRILSGYNYCVNEACTQENNDPYDNHGHGTHVAGIVASNNSTNRGVAFEANLIAIKALNSAGNGDDADVISGINWCVNNATKFNISVISMSLGGTAYTGYCDNNETAYRDAINTAVANNISVVAASGNDASNATILAPACIQNTTSVGAVYDANVSSASFSVCTDSTTAADKITCYTSRNSLLDMLAPGSKITSANDGGGFITLDGTSMATPHVSAAFAMLRQYKRLENGTILNPAQIENTFKLTGINVSDPRTGLNFSRASIYRAIVSIDAIKPLLAVASPTNATYNSTNISLSYSASDNIAPDTCIFTNTTGSNTTLSSCPNITFLAAEQQNNITITVNDSNGNVNSSQVFFTVDTAVPLLTVLQPQNITYNTSNISVSYSVSDSSIDRCWFVNVSGAVIFLNNASRATCANATFISRADMQDNITIYVNDTGGNVNSTIIYFTTDIAPSLNVQDPRNVSYPNTNISVNYTVGNFDTCWLVNTTGHRINLSGCTNTTISAAHGLQNITLFVNDSAGNTNSSQIFFTVDTTSPLANFTSPTPNNETISNTNDLLINVSLSETPSAVLLEWNGMNITMNGSGLSRHYNHADLADGNYTFRVVVNDTAGNVNVTVFRWVYINATRNFSSYINTLNATLSANNVVMLLLNTSGSGDASSIFVDVNYTLRFNIIGIIAEVANFSWLTANTSNLVNVTRNITTDNVSARFSSRGGIMDNYVWIDLNNFTTGNYTPRVMFNGAFRLNYYLNGTRDSPDAVRVNETCLQETNKPCYSITNSTTTIVLLSFSGAAAGNDTQAPFISITSPAGTYSGANISLGYSVSDNVAVDRCWYNLNSGNNITPVNCTNTTFIAASGSNTLVLYANDSSSNTNSSSVSFTYSPSPAPSTSGGGGGGGGIIATALPSTHKRQTWTTITGSAAMNVSIDALPVRSVFVRVNLTVKDVTLSVSPEKSAPVLLENAYQYFTINATNLPEHAVSSAEIVFAVNKSWVANKNKNSVSLNRFANGWLKMQTNLTHENTTHLTYVSTTKGFSYFAVTAEPVSAQQAEAINVTNTTDAAAPNITAPPEKQQICIQVITPAVRNGACVYYPTPCDVPGGWQIVDECPAKTEIDSEVAIGMVAIASVVLLVIVFSLFTHKFVKKKRHRYNLF